MLITMIKTDKLENTEIILKSISYLESRGFTNIKADATDCEIPKSYIRKSTGVKITPDIVAMKNGRKYFFEISLKSDTPKLLKSKWLFLDTLSRMNSNRFRIITTKVHFKFTADMLEDINLSNKTPIKI